MTPSKESSLSLAPTGLLLFGTAGFLISVRLQSMCRCWASVQFGDQKAYSNGGACGRKDDVLSHTLAAAPVLAATAGPVHRQLSRGPVPTPGGRERKGATQFLPTSSNMSSWMAAVTESSSSPREIMAKTEV